MNFGAGFECFATRAVKAYFDPVELYLATKENN